MSIGALAGKIVLLNAPAGAGKDAIAGSLAYRTNCAPASFKYPLIKIALALSGVSRTTWEGWYTREGKELAREELGGLSCRDYLIWVSEDVVKPRHGKQHFGKLAALSLSATKLATFGYVFSDSGFDEEVEPLIDAFGIENIMVVQFTGQGRTNFKGDSRNWLTSKEGLAILATTNDASLDEISTQIIEFCNGNINQPTSTGT